MNSSTSTSKRLNNGSDIDSDRLSELPDSILLHILSFLPTIDAVRTLAIRRFGSLWTQLPSLELSDLALDSRWSREQSEDEDEEFDSDKTKSILRFAKFVTNVLFLHKRVPIQSFKLYFILQNDSELEGPFDEFLDQQSVAWIRSVIDRQVNNLYLHMGCHCPILPHCVFTSQFLVVLNLTRVQINDLSRVQMLSLTKLSLREVEVSNEVLNKIISGSPCLQELDIDNVSGLDELRFTAPNVQKLRLFYYYGLLDCPNLKILDIAHDTTLRQLVHVSSLREVSIGYCYNLNAIKEYLKKFSNVEVFRFLHGKFLDFGQDFLQTRWKCLHIKSMLHGDELLSICRVLRNSPLVEEFIVFTDSQHSERMCDKGMLSLELPSCMMQHLRTVKMCSYGIPCYGLLRLAEFLLRSSVILEKLVILPSKKQSPMVNELKFVKQLLSFPRASTNARVIFGSETCETV